MKTVYFYSAVLQTPKDPDGSYREIWIDGTYETDRPVTGIDRYNEVRKLIREKEPNAGNFSMRSFSLVGIFNDE